MAVLPTVQSARPVARPSRAIAQVSQADAPAREIEGIGREVSQFGDVLFDRETTAEATERDTMLSNRIRDLMYNPETGFASLQGQQAVGAREDTLKKLEALKASAYDGLNATSKRKLQSSADRRIASAMDTVERHTLGQRDTWLSGASQARVEAARQDALVSPAETAAAISVIENETRAQGLREGWGAEKTAVELEAARSQVYSEQIARIASSDPIAAMEYLRDNQEKMVGSDVVNIEARLQPEVKRAVGRRMGATAAAGLIDPSTFDWSKYAVGGAAARSDSFMGLDPEYASRVAALLTAADDELGPGSLTITSAYRSNEKQAELFEAAVRKYGSEAAARKWVAPPGHSKHNSGTAVDFAAAGGGLLRDPDSREAKWIKENAARFGLDVPMDWEPWQVELAGSRGGATPEFDGLGGGMEKLLDISDPIERAAAIDEYNLRKSVSAGRRKASLDAAQDAAFQMIESGGALDDLPLDTRQALGQTAMASLRSYQNTIASGQSIETDDTVYYELRQMQANDPAGFRSVNMMEYRDKLSDAHWKQFVDSQTQPASSVNARAASTLMSTAKRQLTAAGVNEKQEPMVQTRLLGWQDQFIADNGRAPTPLEIDQQVGRELLDTLIDRPGLPDRTDDFFIKAGQEYDIDQLLESTITIGGVEVDNARVRLAASQLRAAGVEVNVDSLITLLRDSLVALGEL